MEIISIFNKGLGRLARELALKTPGITIVHMADFPEGVPIHEDGATVYDPSKSLVLFALMLEGPGALAAWHSALAKFERRTRD